MVVLALSSRASCVSGVSYVALTLMVSASLNDAHETNVSLNTMASSGERGCRSTSLGFDGDCSPENVLRARYQGSVSSRRPPRAATYIVRSNRLTSIRAAQSGEASKTYA